MLPKQLPKFPALKTREGERKTDRFKGKVEVLRRTFFSLPPATNLRDIDGTIYPEPLIIEEVIIE